MMLRSTQRSHAIAEDGEVYAWGFPADGRLGAFPDASSSQVGLRLQSL